MEAQSDPKVNKARSAAAHSSLQQANSRPLTSKSAAPGVDGGAFTAEDNQSAATQAGEHQATHQTEDHGGIGQQANGPRSPMQLPPDTSLDDLRHKLVRLVLDRLPLELRLKIIGCLGFEYKVPVKVQTEYRYTPASSPTRDQVQLCAAKPSAATIGGYIWGSAAMFEVLEPLSDLLPRFGIPEWDNLVLQEFWGNLKPLILMDQYYDNRYNRTNPLESFIVARWLEAIGSDSRGFIAEVDFTMNLSSTEKAKRSVRAIRLLGESRFFTNFIIRIAFKHLTDEQKKNPMLIPGVEQFWRFRGLVEVTFVVEHPYVSASEHEQEIQALETWFSTTVAPRMRVPKRIQGKNLRRALQEKPYALATLKKMSLNELKIFAQDYGVNINDKSKSKIAEEIRAEQYKDWANPDDNIADLEPKPRKRQASDAEDQDTPAKKPKEDTVSSTASTSDPM